LLQIGISGVGGAESPSDERGGEKGGNGFSLISKSVIRGKEEKRGHPIEEGSEKPKEKRGLCGASPKGKSSQEKNSII